MILPNFSICLLIVLSATLPAFSADTPNRFLPAKPSGPDPSTVHGGALLGAKPEIQRGKPRNRPSARTPVKPRTPAKPKASYVPRKAAKPKVPAQPRPQRPR